MRWWRTREGPLARLHRRADGERPSAQPGPAEARRLTRARLGPAARRTDGGAEVERTRDDCGSISAPRPASARPTRCSTRAGAAAAGRRLSSSRSSRPTGARTRGDLRRPRGRPAPHLRVPRHDVERWTSTPSSPAARTSRWSTNSRTPTSPAPTPSAGRTSRAARSGDRRHHHSQRPAPGIAQRRRRGDHRGTANAKPCPMPWCARPSQVELVDMTPRRCAAGWRTATSTPPTRSMRRCRITSGRQPHRAARTRAPVAGRPGRRRAAALPRAAWHRDTWETRERVVVALTGGPEGETLIRRAARIAARATAGNCSRCSRAVRRPDGSESGQTRAPAAPRGVPRGLVPLDRR